MDWKDITLDKLSSNPTSKFLENILS